MGEHGVTVQTLNWEALGAIGEIAGALGVIITLAYLAVQIRQNTRASRITAIQTASENSARFSELLASDPELGELLWRGLRDPESLSPAETRRFVATLNVFMRRESVAFYLHKAGAMPDELWEARLGSLTGLLNQPGTRLFLDLAGQSLPAEFREFVHELLCRPSTMSEKARSVFGP